MKTNSRQVLGSMNDFKWQIQVRVDIDGLSQSAHDSINHSLNTIPMGALKYENSRETMKLALAEKLN